MNREASGPRKVCGGLPLLVASGLLTLAGCRNQSPIPTTGDSDFSVLYRNRDSMAFDAARLPSTLRTTHERVQRRSGLVRSRISEISDEDEIDELKHQLEILSYLDRRITETTRRKPGEKEMLSLNVQAERIINLLEDPNAGSGAQHRFGQMLTGMLPTAIAGHRIPAPGNGGHGTPLTVKMAELESPLLYNPASKDFYRKAELAGMTFDKVAELDVSPGHPAFYRRESRPADTLASFERSMENGVRASLDADGDLPAGTSWDLRKSRRVLFLDEVYKSATSAKAKVEDPYGTEWKMKWGDEVQSEAVSSRLYLLVGGKMTDLVFAGGGGPADSILILAEEGEYDADDKKEREPATVAQLSEALDDFYGFDIAPYIHSHGVIDGGNIGRLLANLGSNVRKKYRREKLIGRHWVSFKEFSVELRAKHHLQTLDGAYLSDLAGSGDRAARGLYLFSLWLAARDSKDDNSKTYFQESPESGITGHFEGQHDLGSTLGAMGAAGRINDMKIGDDFLSLSRTGRAITGRGTFIYKPRAYWDATWSDSKWMALRIANLSDSDLREAVEASGWPDFMQETLFYKLAGRRNQIARLFGINKNGDPPAPNISVDLGSPEKIRAAEKRYGLVPGSLAEDLASRRRADAAGYEKLVSKGQVASSDDSSLIKQLTIQKHPAGLADRYRRMLNRPPKALR